MLQHERDVAWAAILRKGGKMMVLYKVQICGEICLTGEAARSNGSVNYCLHMTEFSYCVEAGLSFINSQKPLVKFTGLNQETVVAQ